MHCPSSTTLCHRPTTISPHSLALRRLPHRRAICSPRHRHCVSVVGLGNGAQVAVGASMIATTTPSSTDTTMLVAVVITQLPKWKTTNLSGSRMRPPPRRPQQQIFEAATTNRHQLKSCYCHWHHHHCY
ncbi:unnamed protein product [Hymenolepis diminuta]|uniref:Uncharacterized protein n=1 Tax=Hymenolepis diminuta TaxID=6216 RepID=A0A564Z2P3_HYMDI|nr:unnamed protein product [Hymenolepis diminuta]